MTDWRQRLKILTSETGLYRPILELRERLTDRDLTVRLEQIYKEQAPAWAGIAQDAPRGDANRPFWLVGALPMVGSIHYEMLAGLVSRITGCAPVVLQTETRFAPWQRRLHQAIGHHQFLDMLTFELGVTDLAIPSDFQAILTKEATLHDLLDLQYRGVPVGRIALTNIGDRHKFTRLTLDNPQHRTELYNDLLSVQRWVHAAETMLQHQRPEQIFFIERSFSPSAELSYVAGREGIPVIHMFNSTKGGEFRFKRFGYQDQLQSPLSFGSESWDYITGDMPWSASMSQNIIDELDAQYLSGAWGSYVFYKSDRRVFSPEEMRERFGLSQDRETAVVFSHILWDQPYQSGTALHDDYETWLIEVIKLAIQNDKLNWLIKLHPDLNWALQTYGKDTSEDLRELQALRSVTGDLPPHVQLVMPDDEASTYSYFAITDYALTVQGTIGMEMAARGVPVITGGTGRYSGYGFTVDPTTRKDYATTLLNLPDESLTMTNDQIDLARRYIYATNRLRPWRIQALQDFKRDHEPFEFALDFGLRPTVDTYAAFQQSPDIQALAAWFAGHTPDYLNDVPPLDQ
jgi:hypothetical protein